MSNFEQARVAYIYGIAKFGHARIVDIEFAAPDEVDPKSRILCGAQNLVLGRGGKMTFSSCAVNIIVGGNILSHSS